AFVFRASLQRHVRVSSITMGYDDQSAEALSGLPNPGKFSKSVEPEQMALIEALVEEQVEQVKSRLFSATAHELRTPLASLRLAAGLLVNAPPPGATEDHRQLFQLILQSSDRLDLLITSLLDYARLEARHLQVE